MYEFAQWLNTTPLADFAQWLMGTPLSVWMQTNFWVIPTLQTIHILAIAGVFGSIFMINLRILGLAGGRRTMTAVAARYLPWVWWGLLVLLVTGIFMIIAEPPRELINPAFWMKMILIVFGVAVSVWFQGTVRRDLAIWEASSAGRKLVRAGAVAVIALWIAIIVLGRWIAYAPT